MSRQSTVYYNDMSAVYLSEQYSGLKSEVHDSIVPDSKLPNHMTRRTNEFYDKKAAYYINEQYWLLILMYTFAVIGLGTAIFNIYRDLDNNVVKYPLGVFMALVGLFLAINFLDIFDLFRFIHTKRIIHELKNN